MRYLYQVVWSAGVFCAPTTMQRAKLNLAVVEKSRPGAELERVLKLPDGARRYWLKDAKGRWVFSHLRGRAKVTMTDSALVRKRGAK